MRFLSFLLLMLAVSARLVVAADLPQSAKNNYHLSPRDMIRVSVFNEPDMTVDRRIDAAGTISLHLLGAVDVNRLTIEEAQEKIRVAYIKAEIFLHPQVSVSVTDYMPKEVSVLGCVKNPGKIVFPIEADELPIVDAISKAGGVTRIGRSDSVRVTRKGADGSDLTYMVDVERMFDGRGGAKPFMIAPGDVIFVPERVL
jgi:protein involved in polysaccharide export with SLBB domain